MQAPSPESVPGMLDKLSSEPAIITVVFVLAGIAILKLLPALIASFRAQPNGAERERADQILAALITNTESRERHAAATAELTQEVRRLNEGLHKRVGPAISGLSAAFLVLSGDRKTARQMEDREQRDGFPPMEKPRGA